MSKKTLQLSKIIYNIKLNGYKNFEIYSEKNYVKFISVQSINSQRQFFIYIPNTIIINTDETDHLITFTETDKDNEQINYLKNMSIEGCMLCCISNKNICLKNDKVFINYLMPNIIDEGYNIYPVFGVLYFLQNVKEFENIIESCYEKLYEIEEQNIESRVESLITSIENKKLEIKDGLYLIFKEIFNIKRDIIKYGDELKKIRGTDFVNKKDTVRYKIERSISDIEDKIEVLNISLAEERKNANDLLLKYENWIIH